MQADGITFADRYMYGVVTDYTGHVYWVEPDVDGYFVATPETGQLLARRGVEAARIRVTGIPVDPAIATPKDPVQMRQVHHLDRAPVVTLMGGGVAVERVEHIIHGLMQRGFTGTLLVVAGRNTSSRPGCSTSRAVPLSTCGSWGLLTIWMIWSRPVTW